MGSRKSVVNGLMLKAAVRRLTEIQAFGTRTKLTIMRPCRVLDNDGTDSEDGGLQ